MSGLVDGVNYYDELTLQKARLIPGEMDFVIRITDGKILIVDAKALVGPLVKTRYYG